MRWRVEFDERAFKELKRLGAVERGRVRRFIDDRLLASGSPRSHGKALSGALANLWRYRVGDIRIIARIEDDALVVHVIEVGHRSEIYR
ncbi:MAG: type II toxin-antitoxin system RelE/ParE family toxin [Devosia sp.]|nr:type II toxin-antitoxin system RelE/ParE family toxin [Devosia sp.]